MSLSSAKRVEQLFNTYFYLHSSTDIRPLPLLGLAPLSPKIYCKALPHPLRVAYFICNGFLCASYSHLCKSRGKSTEITMPDPQFGCLALPWPCRGAENFSWHSKIPPVAKDCAICSLVLPISEAHSGHIQCQQLGNVEWS